MITITNVKPIGDANLSRTKDNLLRASLPIMWEKNGAFVHFFTDSPLTENDRQALEKVIHGLGEFYGEMEYRESVVLI